MPFVLLFIGGLFIAASVNNTQGALYTLLEDDFTGSGNFSYWVISIVAIGSLGYAKPIKPAVDTFLLLLFAVFILANNKTGGLGFFDRFNTALGGALTPQPASAGGAASPGQALVPLGIRSNNPGNLQIGGQEEIFDNPQAGEIAAANNLRAYANQGIDTITGIINRWAPQAAGNNTNAQISAVSKISGFAPDQPLDLSSPDTLRRVLTGIFTSENGQPYQAQVFN